MDDGELGAAGVVGHADDLEFDTAVIRSQVQQLVAKEDGVARVDHGGEDVGVADLVLPARQSHPHSHRSNVSDTYDYAIRLTIVELEDGRPCQAGHSAQGPCLALSPGELR